MSCRRCQADPLADANFCHHCGFLLKAYCFDCRIELPEDSHFCHKCGQNISAYWDVSIQPKRFQQVPQAKTFEETGKVAERKQVSVVFADIKGFTAMSEKLDPERVTEIMNLCFKRLGAVVEKFEGYIDKFMGDCVMVLFGAPIAHENDPELAIDCALHIIDELTAFNRDHDLNLGISIGINSGLVIAGHVGSDQKFEYTVMGDTVNTAQRLQGQAGRNEIFVSKNVSKACAQKFSFGPEIKLQMKGKEHLVEAYKVLGLKITNRDSEAAVRELMPLIGRENELGMAERILDEVNLRRGHILMLMGEPGIGKSRLKSEIRSRARSKNLRWFEAKCVNSSRETPYAAFLELVREILSIDPRSSQADQANQVENLLIYGLDPTALIFLRDFLGLSLSSDEPIRLDAARKHLMLSNAMRSFFVALVSKTPAVLYFEDLHWMDPLSLELLGSFIENVSSMPLLIAGGARPDFKHEWHDKTQFTQIRLRPLTMSQAGELVKHLLHLNEIPMALARVIENRSDGNPLYVEEIIKNLIDKGAMRKAEGEWVVVGDLENLEMPTTLHGLIASRVDRLSPEEKQLLQMASVMGRKFDLEILKKIIRGNQIDSSLATLQRRGLVDQILNERGEVELLFHHALTQEVAYQSILNKVRKNFHAQVADALESTLTPLGQAHLSTASGNLARHFLEAENEEKAFHYLVLNARKLASNFENQGAIENYKRALTLVENIAHCKEVDDKLTECYTQLALVLSMVGQSEFAISCEYKVVEIAETYQNWNLLSRTYRYLGDIHQKLGSFEDALRDMERSMEFANKANDFESEVRTMKSLGNIMKDLQRLEQAQEVLQRGLEGARQLNIPRLIAEYLNDLSTVFLETHELDKAAACLQESIAFTATESELKSLFAASTINLGCVCQYQGDLMGAFSRYQTAGKVAGQIGDLKNVIIAKNNAAEVLLELKDYEQARGELEITQKLAADCGSNLGRVTARIMLGFLLTQNGQGSEGEQILIEMMKEASDRKYWNFYCDSLVYLARYYMEAGRVHEARSALERGLQKADELKNQLLRTRVLDEMKKIEASDTIALKVN